MGRAMPEATVLYVVTAMVVTGLLAWTAVVLAKAKEPWGRPQPPLVAELASPGALAGNSGDPDATAQATPVTVGDVAKSPDEPPK
jgi:hypothetical protein